MAEKSEHPTLQKIKETFTHIGSTIHDYLPFKIQIATDSSVESSVEAIIVVIIILGIILTIIWFYSIFKLPSKNCSNLEKIYGAIPALSVNSINTSNPVFSNNLLDFYIKTAYNCCCGGNFKNDFVDSQYTTPQFCALTNCIQQGARCLDFEIYSYNEKPVIAASSVDSYNIKETFNYLDFNDAMKHVAYAAFSPAICSNSDDPLVLNFRIMSSNLEIFPLMAKSLQNTFGRNVPSNLLDQQYNIKLYCKNLGQLPLLFFKRKVIIVIDSDSFKRLVAICPIIQTQNCVEEGEQSNPITNTSGPSVLSYSQDACPTPNLLEFVNMHSGSPYFTSMRLSQLKVTSDAKTIQETNQSTMCLVLPDYNNSAINTNPSLGLQYGCQMVGMCFQNFDSNMEFYTLFFNKAGSAFALKSESLRYITQYIDLAPPLDPSINVLPTNHTISYGHGVTGGSFQIPQPVHPGGATSLTKISDFAGSYTVSAPLSQNWPLRPYPINVNSNGSWMSSESTPCSGWEYQHTYQLQQEQDSSGIFFYYPADCSGNVQIKQSYVSGGIPGNPNIIWTTDAEDKFPNDLTQGTPSSAWATFTWKKT